MTEFSVHFQRGWKVGARSLRIVTVLAENATAAVRQAKKEWEARKEVRSHG